MRCYYRYGISCGANRREFEDQSLKKGKLGQIGIRPIRVYHFGDFWKAFREKRKEERKEEKKKRRRGFQVWIAIVLYGFVNICMDLYGMDSWIHDLVLCLGFCYEKF